ncbi:MAG: hypothetical protein ACM31C_13100 [Acidobacteriota bacterium]
MRSILFASLLAAAACSSESAYADQVAGPVPPGPRTALAIANAKVRAPYDVQVIREDGETMPTYALKDRYYVQGNAGDRYIIRVTNPTPNRVEAVVSVDGLDVIDGDEGDLHKRGYIVPAFGDVRIEGFRTSLDDVATFRFSSVDGSYAGKKGKARNVGVIAVAIFEEQHQQIVEPAPVIIGQNAPAKDRPYDYRDDMDASRAPAPAAERGHGRVARADKKAEAETTASRPMPAPPPAAAPRGGYYGGAAGAPAAKAPAPRREAMTDEGDDIGGGMEQQAPAQPTNRLGLGTEFGESRTSSATYTRFVRATNRPIAIAELRYNDAAGLMALGINVQPLPDEGEIMTRETADPFPGDRHFSNAP